MAEPRPILHRHAGPPHLSRMARRCSAYRPSRRAFTGPAVVQRDYATPVDAPRHVMLVLACGDTSVAFDAAIGVAQEFHASHDGAPSSCADLAQRTFCFLHAG